ncbi:hypothetical protein HBI38_085530 [Parastagonospora nodorum]|nr:hypothetical protein HBI73_191770 [Parastagonospora nodorum]KAH5095223.1 hypothetical protein HBH72_151600 [Parastagonospora nodorum]KAH5536792.1 hypothetical protein HBI27_149430 [Parastagonospora nodorum]KAH5712797.1 hypothetical protein HBI20_161700 [Parastagonospora nodorum]KAH6071848.1 hypothetical protein HBI67_082170 [Parastagonospora nodorum]
MYPQEYATLVSEANAGTSQNFLLFERDRASALDTGLFNYFKDERGTTNCTIGDAVFSGQGQYGQFVWPDSSSYGIRPKLPTRFGAPMNFWSCALYPNITQASRSSGLSPQNRTYLLENNVDTTEAASVAVTSFISTCLSTWCRESGNCGTSSCAIDQLKIGKTMLSAASLDTCLDHLCRPIPRISSNPDIAGIGVISSYYIQFGFVIAGLLSLILCSVALKRTSSPRSPQSDSECDKDPPAQPRLLLMSINQTIITALDDFQRAQCSFALAINTASLITLQLSAKTLSFVDRRAIIAASASGTLPTTLVLAALMASNKRHLTFTFCITFAAWALSLSVGLHPQIFRYRDASGDYLTKYPGVCGKSPPVNACGHTNPDVFGMAPTLFPIAIATMIALTWWKFRSARIFAKDIFFYSS